MADNDNDGLNNLEEYKLKTNPKKADTDSDGLSDGREKELSSSPLLSDSDSDGLNDKEEIDAGTNPIKADSDDDGFSDLKEIEVGSNPIDSNSIPPTPPADEPLFFFDFEGDEDDRVLDKGERGNDGIIVTLDTVELGINEGAPRGSTGSTSVRFNNGHIDVPGVPLDEIIAGDGSYTMAAWLNQKIYRVINSFLVKQFRESIMELGTLAFFIKPIGVQIQMEKPILTTTSKMRTTGGFMLLGPMMQKMILVRFTWTENWTGKARSELLTVVVI